MKFESSDSDIGVNDEDMYSAPLRPFVLERPEEVEYMQPTGDNLKPGTYILVNVLGGYRKTVNYKYVCCIQSILHYDDDDEEFDEDSSPTLKVMGL